MHVLYFHIAAHQLNHKIIKMYEPVNIDRAHFLQLHSAKNASFKETVCSMLIAKAKATLMSPPFCYPEKISKAVSEGIVKYGDKLMCNAMAESDSEDDDQDIDELNQLGDDFEAMISNTQLELNVDGNRDCKNDVKIFRNLYPRPEKSVYVKKSCVNKFGNGLENIRDYLNYDAHKGLTATIALIGDTNKDGVIFGGNQTVPLQIIEGQIQNFLNGRGGQILPMAVDLIVKDSSGIGIKVSTIKPHAEIVQRVSIEV